MDKTKKPQHNMLSKNSSGVSFSFVPFLGGGIGGAVGVTATQPLDFLKTRLQARQQFSSVMKGQEHRFMTRTAHALIYTAQREGLKGLYQGLLPNLVGVIPSRSIYFGTYGISKDFIRKARGGKTSTINHMLSAAIATVIVTSVMNPIFFLKTRIQLEIMSKDPRYRTYRDCVKHVYKTEGIKAFWKGLTASWLGISEGALYFAFYEHLKYHYFREQTDRSSESFNPLIFLSLSASCKLAASAITYPHEVMRTRLREVGHGSGLLKTFVDVYKHEGYRGYYSGMGAHLSRVVPNTALMFMCYEATMWYFKTNPAKELVSEDEMMSEDDEF